MTSTIYVASLRPRLNNCGYTLDRDGKYDARNIRRAYRRMRTAGLHAYAARSIIIDLLMAGRFAGFQPNTLPENP